MAALAPRAAGASPARAAASPFARRLDPGTGRVASTSPPAGIPGRGCCRRRGAHHPPLGPGVGRVAARPLHPGASPGGGSPARRWRRASHPAEPTGAERAARLVPAAQKKREHEKERGVAAESAPPPSTQHASTAGAPKTHQNTHAKSKSNAEAVTEKWGLEAGLWNVFRSKESADPATGETKMATAKKLLKRYGSAYLITSISLSLVSITACYALISAGVDVPGLLDRVGLGVTSTSEKFGTFALAYAAHKASSPIRFPPTVALTPVVAGWLGKEPKEEEEEEEGGGA
jgi:hypothetical protein